MMRVSVVGGGVDGLVSAYVLAKAGVEVVLYEKQQSLGGHHPQTLSYHDNNHDAALNSDLIGFTISNQAATHPSIMDLLETLGIELEQSPLSFSVSLQDGHGCEWGARNGLSSLFAQTKNALNPYFWKMTRDIVKFKQDSLSYLEMLESNPDIDCSETIGQFINSRGYSQLFQTAYLVPICCSIWSCSPERLFTFSAYSVLSFCRSHRLLELFGQEQRLTLKKGSHSFVSKVREELERKGCEIRTGCEVHSVTTTDEGCTVISGDGSEDKFNGCIMAVHAPDAMKILGNQATSDEIRVLGAFQYVYSDVYLHRDKSLMPRNPEAWSTWSFLSNTDNNVCWTYWLNALQNVEEDNLPFLVTLNPYRKPENALLKWTTGRPVPSVAATKACFELGNIQGRRGIWFCGAYKGFDFHEDGLKAGMIAANDMLGKSCDVLSNPRHMEPSWMETGARLFVTRFFRKFISAGVLIFLEDGGTVFRFEGSIKKCSLKVVLKIHSPQFYWKVMTHADLGLADAYVNGDFSFIDDNEGLLNLFLILIANKNLDSSASQWNKKRAWWRPMLFTAAVSSAKYFFKHVSRQNTLTQARRNISRHYDLSNDLFSLFLDETMTYSCAVFKAEHEDLKVAQMRKLSSLIDKARIEKEHNILDIGCGWGGLAIEVVKRTGCKYTGITLSEEQRKFAEARVKEAGLQDNIRFLLCDYREMPDTCKYDRIISCGMIEHIGQEYVETFFGCCDSLLAEDGLFVVQFISMPEPYYEEYIKSGGFIKEYIFPGGSIPSLTTITSAMAASSNFCVEHVENIGIHYYQTLRCWRKNFLENRSKILALGFDDKFIRTWEYYFDYAASGFKSRILGDYQIVFSRPGNVAAFTDPYTGFPPAY